MIRSAASLGAALLPWASEQRWFPTGWPPAPWADAILFDLVEDSSAQVLFMRPDGSFPWLQVPLTRSGSGGGVGVWQGQQYFDGVSQVSFWRAWLPSDHPVPGSAVPLGREQSNSSAILNFSDGSRWVGKIFRVVFPGLQPDYELPFMLAQRGWQHVPTVTARRDFDLPGGSYCSGVCSQLVPNATDGFDYFHALATAKLSGAEEALKLGKLVADLQRNLGQRIHGDLHLGQLLLTDAGGWFVLDFEGNPLRPLSVRNQPDHPLRDVASLLRSFDYAAPDDQPWVEECRAAFLAGYGRIVDAQLLNSFEIERAQDEVDYESQFRPDRLTIPLAALKRLVTKNFPNSNP